MARVAVVTDSAACVPSELVREYQIHVVPFELALDGRRYRDGIDLTPGEFYRLLRQATSWPTTSVPPLGSFAAIYAELGKEAEGIISIHVAAEFSSTVQVARLAARLVSSVPVRVIDSRSGAIAEGFVVLAAASAAVAGASLDKVVAAAEAAIPRVGLFSTLETLQYLHRGGRIGEAAALLGSCLHTHPVLELASGHVKVVGVTHGRRQALERIVEAIAERVSGQPACISAFHADASVDLAWLEARLRALPGCREFYATEFTPIMGAHTGPGAVGAAYWLLDER
ncbi:MAG: DegV family protein [Anaerolineae bacterium]